MPWGSDTPALPNPIPANDNLPREIPLENPVPAPAAPGSVPPANGLLEKGNRKTKLNRENVGKAMAMAGGNKVKAAKLLNVGRATLNRFFKDNPVESLY